MLRDESVCVSVCENLCGLGFEYFVEGEFVVLL